MADMIADADAEDLERWRREGRDDILQGYRDACWVGDHFMSVTTGMTIHDCPFLDWEGCSHAGSTRRGPGSAAHSSPAPRRSARSSEKSLTVDRCPILCYFPPV